MYIYFNSILEFQKVYHLTDKSCYNSNYYKIVNDNTSEVCEFYGNNIIHEECDEFSETYTYSVGKFTDKGVFMPVFTFSTSENTSIFNEVHSYDL